MEQRVCSSHEADLRYASDFYLSSKYISCLPCSIYQYEILIVDISTLLKNIDIDTDIDMVIFENIDIDIDKAYLENIDIEIDIDKAILKILISIGSL